MRARTTTSRAAAAAVMLLVGAAVLLTGATGASAAVPKGTLVAAPSCYFLNADGSYSVNADVTNTSTDPVTIKIGGENKFDPGKDDQGQPETFAPGTTTNVAQATFKATDWSKAKWRLNGVDYPLTTTTLCSAVAVPADGNPLST